VPGGPEGALGPYYVTYVFTYLGSIIICRSYKLTPSDRAQVILQLTVFPIYCEDFKPVRTLAGGGDFFHRGPHPLSGALKVTCLTSKTGL